jgi:hypothetical protein
MITTLVLLAGLGAAREYVTLSANFVAPAKPGGSAAIAVTFIPTDPEVHVNQEPPPRLKLDSAQKVLVDRQLPAPTRGVAFDPDTAKYLDSRTPVSFPVAWAPGAPKGAQSVRASVSYFFCSKREGWCRKGTADVEVPINVP